MAIKKGMGNCLQKLMKSFTNVELDNVFLFYFPSQSVCKLIVGTLHGPVSMDLLVTVDPVVKARLPLKTSKLIDNFG